MSKVICLDISVLNDPQRTGIANYTYELIEGLLKINKIDKFILFGIATIGSYSYLRNLPLKNYPNVQMKILKMPSKLFRRTFIVWQKINWPPVEKFTGEIDIFHSFNWYLPPTRKAKLLGTFFDMTAIKFPEWHEKRTTQLNKILFERMAKNCTSILCISQQSKKDFLTAFPGSKIEVVYPAVAKRFNPEINALKDYQVLKKYKLKKDYILTVATLEPRKNLERLIKAYLSSGVKEKLVLVGKKGWKNQKLEKLIKHHTGKIRQLGFIPESNLPTLYRNARCFIYPSFYEGFGMPVLEAMSCAVPVIISNTSSLPEVGGEAAVYIDPHDTESIKKSLIKVVKDGKLRKELSKKSILQSRKFSWEKSARKLDSLLKSL